MPSPRTGPHHNPRDIIRLSSNQGAAHGAHALRKCFPDEIAALCETGESTLVQLWAAVPQKDGEYQAFTARLFLQKRTPLLFLRAEMLQALGLHSHAELQLRREGDRVLCSVVSVGVDKLRKRQRGGQQGQARGAAGADEEADTDTDEGEPAPTPQPEPIAPEPLQSPFSPPPQPQPRQSQLGQGRVEPVEPRPQHLPPTQAMPAQELASAHSLRLPSVALPAVVAAPAVARRPLTVADLGPSRGPQVLVYNRSQGACTGAAAIHRHYGAQVAAVKSTGASQRGRLWARPCLPGAGLGELQEFELRVTCSKHGTVGLGFRMDLVRALGIMQPPLVELGHIVLRLSFEGEGEGRPLDPDPPPLGQQAADGGRRVLCEVVWLAEELQAGGAGGAGAAGPAGANGANGAGAPEPRRSGSGRASRASAQKQAAAAAAELQMEEQRQQLLLLQQLQDQQPHPAHLAARLVPIGGAAGYLEDLYGLYDTETDTPWQLAAGGTGGGSAGYPWPPPRLRLDESTVEAIFRQSLRSVAAVMMQQGMRRLGQPAGLGAQPPEGQAAGVAPDGPA